MVTNEKKLKFETKKLFKFCIKGNANVKQLKFKKRLLGEMYGNLILKVKN